MAKDRSSDAAPNGSTAQDQHYLYRLLRKRKTITEWGPDRALSKIHSELESLEAFAACSYAR